MGLPADCVEIRSPQAAAVKRCAPPTTSDGTSVARHPVENGTLSLEAIECRLVPSGARSHPLTEQELQHNQCPRTPRNHQLANLQTQEEERISAAPPVHGLKSWSRQELSPAQSIIHNIYAYVSSIKNKESLMPVYFSNLEQDAFARRTSTIAVKWPCELVYTGSAVKKSEALAVMSLVIYDPEKVHSDKDMSPKTASDQERTICIKKVRNATSSSPKPMGSATISMSKRVAAEQNQDLKDTGGNQMKLSKQLLTVRGGMLFCTVVIRLRHLQHNSKLWGLSHVIVD
ncbi:hypothetical protein HPB50_017049 [Hyalomma asiaticum]|uniref:Uncharacterized protein n=1 Tax=Hyalomma asiaticum TaxID=266040 RepID=A0ACB7THQ6_HYAAI|nr:hypothetical protein HPB50_017049 [Hyalomma asiaticum]